MKYYKIWTHDMSGPILIVRAESLKEALTNARKDNPSYTQGEEYKEANKCPFFRRQKIKEPRRTQEGRPYIYEYTAELCIGQRNNTRCDCKGDRSRCKLRRKDHL